MDQYHKMKTSAFFFLAKEGFYTIFLNSDLEIEDLVKT